MELVRFYAWVIRPGIALALCGQLKTCTLSMMSLSADETGLGMISYSKYTRLLLN